MKPGYYIEEEELLKQAIQALTEKLGPLETFRFLAIPQKKRVESVKRHHQWQAKLDEEQFFNEVFTPNPSFTGKP
jgi:hypothetical protein